MNLCTYPCSLCTYICYFTGSHGGKGVYGRKEKRPRIIESSEDEIEEESEEESEDEILPTRSTARTQGRQPVQKQAIPKPFTKLRLHEYRAYREINPYDKKRFPSVRNPHFHTNEQERVYQEVYLGSTNKHKVVIQHSIDLEHMKKDKLRSYFAEALAMCREFGLLDIMTFNHPYIEYYILQFYSTVHFWQ